MLSVATSTAKVAPTTNCTASTTYRARTRGSLTIAVSNQGHKDRLSAVDASFLAQERQSSHMHVGALVIFEGPPPSREDFVEHIESRLGLVPRYRQKLAFPRFEMGRPFWVDDPQFNIDYHVRHTALPAPGSIDQLRGLVGRIFSQRLDRSKPLWELWLVQGLESGKFALISKTHHALVDGVSGVDLSAVLFDLGPVPAGDRGRRRGVDARGRALRRRAGGRGGQGPAEAPGRAGRPGGRRPVPPRPGAGRGPRGRRGRRRDRVGGPEPGARGAAEPDHRAAPAAVVGAVRARAAQGDQELAGRHGQRRGADRGGRRRRALAARARRAHRGPGAAGAGARLDPRRGRARPARQPDRRDARPAAGLRRGPGRAPADRAWRRWRGSRSPSRRWAPR